MPNASVKVSDDFYTQIQAYAKSHHISISEVFRQGVEHLLDKEEQHQNDLEPVRTEIEPFFLPLSNQLDRKDEQIVMGQKNINDLIGLVNALRAKLETKDSEIQALRAKVSDTQNRGKRPPWWRLT